MTSIDESTPTSVTNGTEENTVESTHSSIVNDLFVRFDRKFGHISWLSKDGKLRLIQYIVAAEHIDPETAEVKWEYRPFLDRYEVEGIRSKTTRSYFARSPGSDIWVPWTWLGDKTELSLWEKHKQTDPALCEPTSCWTAFVHSHHFRDDRDKEDNLFCYFDLGVGNVA
jgi:hypothetical protein